METGLQEWKKGGLERLLTEMAPFSLLLIVISCLDRLHAFSFKIWVQTPAKSALIAAIGLSSLAPSVHAGPEAKQTFFAKEDDSKIGTSLYNENDAISSKLEGVDLRWKKMIADCKKAQDKSGIKRSIEINMAALKLDMRTISKVKSGGDILERNGKVPTFDYNSGQFTLLPIPAQAEAVIAKINDIYFYSSKGSQVEAQKCLNEVDEMFKSWLSLVSAR